MFIHLLFFFECTPYKEAMPRSFNDSMRVRRIWRGQTPPAFIDLPPGTATGFHHYQQGAVGRAKRHNLVIS